MQSSEASKKYLLRGKKGQYQWIDTWVDSESKRVAESYPHCGLNYFYGALLLSFLWSIILICLIYSLYLVYLRILRCVHTHLLAKMESTERAYR